MGKAENDENQFQLSAFSFQLLTMGTGYTINDSGFQSRMAQLAATARRPEGLMKSVGQEGRNQLVRHFRGRNASYASNPRHLGFYLEIARSVQNPMVNEPAGQVKISITDERFAQKVFGGDISAKRVSKLTIPVSDEAYGRRASVFERETGRQLFRVHAKSGVDVLMSKRNRQAQLEYVLKQSVHQDKDPNALPDESKLGAALLDRAESVIKHQFSKI